MRSASDCFPFGGKLRGSEHIRQHRHKGGSVLCGDKLLSLALCKARLHQLFNNGGAGGGSAKPPAFCVRSVSSFPARSIADKRVASLWGFGGVVKCSVTFAWDFQSSVPRKAPAGCFPRHCLRPPGRACLSALPGSGVQGLSSRPQAPSFPAP